MDYLGDLLSHFCLAATYRFVISESDVSCLLCYHVMLALHCDNLKPH